MNYTSLSAAGESSRLYGVILMTCRERIIVARNHINIMRVREPLRSHADFLCSLTQDRPRALRYTALAQKECARFTRVSSLKVCVCALKLYSQICLCMLLFVIPLFAGIYDKVYVQTWDNVFFKVILQFFKSVLADNISLLLKLKAS